MGTEMQEKPTPSLTDQSVFEDLPPKAPLVYFAIREYGPISKGELNDLLPLSDRAVRYNVKELVERTDFVEKRYDLNDLRRRMFTIVAEHDPITDD